jgi:UDP-N-acetyl-D-glucosamine dehydrogenase
LEKEEVNGVSKRTQLADKLIEKIKKKEASVAVLGLGYVGLPLAIEKAKTGFSVFGIDKSEFKVTKLNRGESYIRGIDEKQLKEMVNLGRLTAATDPAKIKEADVIIICVPTPLTPNKDPDLTYIKEAVKQVEKHLRPGHLITLESTTYPGTTEEIVLPNLAKTGLKVGEDYFLAFSPERVDPGNSNFNTKNTTKIVGGVTKQCTRVASTFYRQTIENVVEVSSPAIAEMAKIFENTYRAVNIALVNEFMLLCSKMKIDIWEVLDAAATKPFGIQVFYPGPGIGGHCIPIDPYYLAWKAKEYDFSLRFVDLAGQINNEAIWYVISLLNSILNEKKKSLRGANLLLVGVAYKRDVDDYRESPSLKIISILRENGANVSYHDPFIPEIYLSAKGTYLQSVELTKENLAKADCTLIITDHSNLDYQFIVDNAQVVLDTRNATKNVQKGREKIIRV